MNEGEFIAEVIDPLTGKYSDEGELVITNLDWLGSPIIHYKTGDQARLNRARCECGRTFARMDGGIIGRIDQMLIVRGVNIFPSAIEAIVRAYPEVEEFAIEVDRVEEMDELTVRVEVRGADASAVAEKVARNCNHRMGLRVKVLIALENSLPRFELKAKRLTNKQKNYDGVVIAL